MRGIMTGFLLEVNKSNLGLDLSPFLGKLHQDMICSFKDLMLFSFEPCIIFY